MRKSFLFAAAAAGVLCRPMLCAAETGVTGASTLARPLGARPSGMGQAFCAVDGDLDSITYNPAGLALAQRPALQTQYTRGLFDDSFSAASYVQPLPFGSVWGSLLYYNAGNVQLNLSDGTNSNVTAEQDFAGVIGTSIKLPEGFTVGGAAKVYRLELAQQATATGFAADLGAQWHTPIEGLSLGASERNIGPDVKFEQQGDPLPLETRVGAAWQAKFSQQEGPRTQTMDLLFTVDGVKPKDDAPWAGVGVEMKMAFGAEGTIALRVGYVFNSPIDSVTAGVGMREGRYFLDYALGDEKVISNVQHFVIGFLF